MSSPSLNVPKNQKQSRAEIIALVRRTLSILAQAGQTIELRIPGIQGKRTDSGYFNDFDKLAVVAADYENRAEGVYITINPVQPALLARSSNRVKEYAKQTTSDKDILRRRWLFIDFDPVRPAGISSSDEESQQAVDRATACREQLASHGIPSLLAHSGNGAHLLIPIDWPNNETSTALIKEFLARLDTKFSDEHVKVDTGMVGASHLIKLYGTMARKGDCIPERPHRRSMIIDVPESLTPVSEEAIQKLILPGAAPIQALGQNDPTPERKEQPNDSQDRHLIDEVKVRLDMVAFAEQHLGVQAVGSGHEFRLPGNGGFLINPEKRVWYRHGGQEGGDALDLVGNCLFGSAWNKHDAEMFKRVLQEAATFADVPIPRAKTRSHFNAAQKIDVSPSPSHNHEDSSTQADPAAKLDLLDVAMAWHAKYGQELAWDVDRAGWRRWAGTHWQLERTSESLDLQAAQMMREIGVAVYSGSRTDGMLKFARGLCKRKFSHRQSLVNFKNGTLDLATMQLCPHEREDHLTRCLPHDYDTITDFARVRQFLERTIPDPVARQAYMTHIGVALAGDVSLHKAVILFGPTRSGKTSLLKLAQATLGYKPGQFPTSTLFSSESRGANSRATWIDSNPKLVCLDEFPQDALGGEGEELFKSMTAHGGVSMWLKYQDERDENTWTPKLMFATNNRLHYRDQSGALTRRLLIIDCPNSVPETKQDGDLLKKLEPELGAFAAACIRLALAAQQSRQYPESEQMSRLLNDIETNGDSIKLWLLENCVFEDGAFESTAALYQNYRYWCDENGVNAAGRPKMRDVITTYRPNVVADRRRINDPKTGEIKLVWGLVGVRLRIIEDDFPNDERDPISPDDPVPPTTGLPQEPDHQAIRSGDPADSQKITRSVEREVEASDPLVKDFSPSDRITGSAPLKMTETPSSGADLRGVPVGNPFAKGGEQQPLLLNQDGEQTKKRNVLRYYPDLAPRNR